MEVFQGADFVRLRSLVHGTHVYADEDRRSIILDPRHKSHSAVWAVEAPPPAGDGEGTGHVLLRGAYGRYLGAPLRGLSQRKASAAQRDLDEPNIGAIRWQAVAAGNNGVWLLDACGRYLQASSRRCTRVFVSISPRPCKGREWEVETVFRTRPDIPIPMEPEKALVRLRSELTRRQETKKRTRAPQSQRSVELLQPAMEGGPSASTADTAGAQQPPMEIVEGVPSASTADTGGTHQAAMEGVPSASTADTGGAQSKELVRLRSLVYGTYVHAHEDGRSVILDTAVELHNAVWVAERGHSGDGKVYVLLQAANGRYLGVPDGQFPLLSRRVLATQLDFDHTKRKATMWQVVAMKGVDAVVLHDSARRYLHASASAAPFLAGICSSTCGCPCMPRQWVIEAVPRPSVAVPVTPDEQRELLTSKMLDLLEEYEALNVTFKNIKASSRKLKKGEVASLWISFNEGMEKCQVIRGEIKAAGGYPPSIPTEEELLE